MSFTEENINYITQIQFNIFSNENIINNSSITEKDGIVIPETYDGGEPKRGGIVDTRLGITDGNLECAYCGLNANNCPGHFGHTQLAQPIFHYGFLNHVRNILSCICLKTSKLLIDKESPEIKKLLNLNKRNRFNEIKILSKKILVSDVGIPVHKIKEEIKNSIINFVAEYNIVNNQDSSKKKIKEYLSAIDVYKILKNISNEDWKFLGFDSHMYRPEDFLIINLPIPPVTIRPSLKTEFLALSTFEDSLIHILVEILKSNNKLKKINEHPKVERGKYDQDTVNLLQYHAATLYDNDSLKLAPNEQKIGGKPAKSISERLKGKTGRIRGNLMGKRVDFSARTVITPDPNIQINELGIPIKMAMNLTFPEIVTIDNKVRLSKLINNGRKIYPGANYVKKKSRFNNKQYDIIDLNYRRNVLLELGDIVDRHLVDGDYVLFNRQPSLHKLSMMAHKIKVIQNKDLYTFRMNVSATPPYNADFDGDEMNIHVPQTIQTKTELQHIANLKYHIISPKDSSPIISFVQDSLIGVYKLTLDDIEIDWRDVMNLLVLCNNLNLNNIIKNKKYTGKALYSKLIPNNINAIKDDGEIINGNIVKGPINSSCNKLLVSNIWYKYNANKTKDYIFNTQRLVSSYLLFEGFTVGIGDLIINNKLKIEIIKSIEKKKMETNHLITEIENNPELIDAYTFEESLRENLKAHKGVIEKMVMNNLDNSNNFYTMSKHGSGSKGSGINMMQMVGALGQDILEFKRIQKKVNDRTLPHYFQNDDRAEARGFIERSYYDGLSPQEFFFHNMTSREGLIDTAIKTQDTGYIARRLMKGLEDIMIKYDGTVRTVNNRIIQMVYGDNGIEQIKQTIQKLHLIKKDNNELMKDYFFNNNEIKELVKKSYISNTDNKKFSDISNKYYSQLKGLRDEIRNIQKIYTQNYVNIIDEYASPVNFKRLITDIKNYKNINDDGKKVSPIYIYEKIEYILKPGTTILLTIKNKYKNTNNIKILDEIKYKFLFRLLLFEYISPKKIINNYKLSKFKFDILINQIIEEYNNGMVEPGEMVGSLGAQHIGEPSTQMTLNTFHATGSGNVGMLGVPRLREIISLTKEIKTPTMQIYMEDNNNYNKTKIISSYIKTTHIKDLITNYSIIFEHNNDNIIKKDKVSNMLSISIGNNTNLKAENIPFVLRLEINKNMLVQRDMSLLDIKIQFTNYWKKNFGNIKNIKKQYKNIIMNIINCGIMSNNDNSEIPIIHIRFNMKNYDMFELIDIKDLILNIKLKGIDNITNVYNPVERQYIDYTNDKLETKKEYFISTEGQNIINIRYIKGIDLNRTITNDIIKTYKYFGVEAARSIIIKELTNVFVSGGNDVNYHHLSILVDLIINNGKLTSIDRHGLGKLDNGPLSKASFERPVDILLNAAIYNEVDDMNSVSSRIIAGRTIDGGTCCFDVLMDNEMIENSELIDKKLLFEEFEILFQENELLNYYMNKKEIDGFIPI